jgi:hypothetical protein
MCFAVSGAVRQSGQMTFVCPLFLMMRSAVQSLFCRSSQEKNLHLAETKVCGSTLLLTQNVARLLLRRNLIPCLTMLRDRSNGLGT